MESPGALSRRLLDGRLHLGGGVVQDGRQLILRHRLAAAGHLVPDLGEVAREHGVNGAPGGDRREGLARAELRLESRELHVAHRVARGGQRRVHAETWHVAGLPVLPSEPARPFVRGGLMLAGREDREVAAARVDDAAGGPWWERGDREGAVQLRGEAWARARGRET